MDTKRCSHCGDFKPVNMFSKSKARGYQTYCKPCANALRTQWARDNRDKTRQYKLKYEYDLSADDYEQLVQKQNNACAICREIFIKTPNVDHDHATNKVRGLLCSGCNIFVGHIENRMLDEALRYLDNHALIAQWQSVRLVSA